MPSLTVRNKALDAVNETSTALLLQVATAVQLAEQVPPETGRRLVRLAKAARLFIGAREPQSAADAIDTMLALLPADEPELRQARGVVERAAKRVRASIDFTVKMDAKADATLRGETKAAAA